MVSLIESCVVSGLEKSRREKENKKIIDISVEVVELVCHDFDNLAILRSFETICKANDRNRSLPSRLPPLVASIKDEW